MCFSSGKERGREGGGDRGSEGGGKARGGRNGNLPGAIPRCVGLSLKLIPLFPKSKPKCGRVGSGTYQNTHTRAQDIRIHTRIIQGLVPSHL